MYTNENDPLYSCTDVSPVYIQYAWLHTSLYRQLLLLLLRFFVQGTALSKYAKKILLATKPAPVLESAYKGEQIVTNYFGNLLRLGITIVPICPPPPFP